MTRMAEEDAFLVRRAGRLKAHREEVTGRALVRRELVGISGRTLEFDQLSSALSQQGAASLLTGVGQAAGTGILIAGR